jgi:gluconate 5-dehydrogenase
VFSLNGKVALVTGASRGLGWAMARALAQAGATVLINGRDEATLQPRVAELAKAGLKGEVAAFDVTDEKAAAACIQGAVQRHGRFDILVANAGIQHRRPITEFETDDFDRVLRTNLTAVWMLAREAARVMIPRKSGRIIMTGSASAILARPTISAYVASKGAVHAMTRELAVELAPHNITVNAIAPGYFATSITAATRSDPVASQRVLDHVPAARWGETSDLMGAVVFLASRASDYVNGHVLTVDGGYLVR